MPGFLRFMGIETATETKTEWFLKCPGGVSAEILSALGKTDFFLKCPRGVMFFCGAEKQKDRLGWCEDANTLPIGYR